MKTIFKTLVFFLFVMPLIAIILMTAVVLWSNVMFWMI